MSRNNNNKNNNLAIKNTESAKVQRICNFLICLFSTFFVVHEEWYQWDRWHFIAPWETGVLHALWWPDQYCQAASGWPNWRGTEESQGTPRYPRIHFWWNTASGKAWVATDGVRTRTRTYFSFFGCTHLALRKVVIGCVTCSGRNQARNSRAWILSLIASTASHVTCYN